MTEQHPSMEELRQVIRDELRPVWKRMERHDREIYGHNGTPGLTTRVQENTSLRKHIQRLYFGLGGTLLTFGAYIAEFFRFK